MWYHGDSKRENKRWFVAKLWCSGLRSELMVTLCRSHRDNDELAELEKLVKEARGRPKGTTEAKSAPSSAGEPASNTEDLDARSTG